MTDFAALVAALAATDDAQRKPAEAAYEQLKKDSPQPLVGQLVQLARGAPDEATRAFAAVLLRRLVAAKHGVYAQLDAATQSELKAQLLAALGAEPVAHIRRKLTHTVAELAAVSSAAEQPWPELFGAVSALSAHGDAAFRETAFVLVAALADEVGSVLAAHKESFLTLFTNALNDASGQVQVESLKAAAAFLVTLESAHDIDMFGFIVAPLLKILELLLQSEDEATVRELLGALVQIAEVHPKFFKPQIAAVADAMLFLVAHRGLETDTRELALEVVLSLCERAGAMVRKHSKPTVTRLVPLVIELQTEVEDDDAWTTKFDDPQTFTETAEDGEGLSDAAAAAIDRLASALGGNTVLPAAIPVIEAFLRDANDWKKRRAALYTTCLLGEGCKAQLATQLDSVAALVLPFLGDNHVRVQYAAVHCVGQLAEDFGEVAGKKKNFQAKFHGAVLPALTQILASDAVPLRTRALAASVVVNFTNPLVCKPKHVAPHAAALLEALFHALRTTPRQVQEQALTAVATVAKVLGDGFAPYYDIFMPLAKDVLVHAVGDDFALLRGKAMESIALIGQAVGKARFAADATQVMDILVRLHANDEAAGVEIQYVAQACVRIGSLLKRDFVPYLPYVVPPLLKQAAVAPDVVLTDLLNEATEATEATGSNAMEELTIEGKHGDKRRLQVNTSALQDKLNACNMLYQCALDLDGAFYPYVADAATVLLPLVAFPYIDDIRIVSALTLSRLLASAVDGSLSFGHLATAPQFPQQLFDQALDALLQALPEEEEPEVRSALAEALSALLEVAKTSSVDKGLRVGLLAPQDARTAAVVDAIKAIAAESAEALVRVHAENAQDEDFDADEAAQQSEALELEEGVFRSMVDALGWLIKTHGAAFFPTFQRQLLPFVTPLLEAKTGVDMLRGQAICMVDDVIEHCGAAAQELLPLFIGHLVRGLEDASPAVIQASAYGVGVCAEKTTAAFAPFAPAALDKLVAVVDAASEEEDDEVLAARDNAVSAVAKILLAYEAAVDAAGSWKRWLSWLPLKTDAIEARDLHARLISWVANGHAHLLAELPALLGVFASILLHDPTEGEDEPAIGVVDEDEEDLAIISDDGKRQLKELLAKLQTQLPAEVVQGAWATLSGEQQQALAELSKA